MTKVGWEGVIEGEKQNEGFILARSLVAWVTDCKEMGETVASEAVAGNKGSADHSLPPCTPQHTAPPEISSRNIVQTAHRPRQHPPHPAPAEATEAKLAPLGGTLPP